MISVDCKEFKCWCTDELMQTSLVKTLEGQTCVMALEILSAYPRAVRNRLWRRMDASEHIVEECVRPLSIRLEERKQIKEW